MTPQSFTEEITKAMPRGLKSVIIYGPCIEPGYEPVQQDYHLLLVTASLKLEDLKSLAQPTAQWVRFGFPSPLLFTEEHLRMSDDVFPLKITEIKQNYKVLWGEDCIKGIHVSVENFRLELEHELKAELIKFREGYLRTGGDDLEVLQLLMGRLPFLSNLLRSVIRLYQEQVPFDTEDLINEASQKVNFDPKDLLKIKDLKAGTISFRDVQPDALFESYLRCLELIVDKVDNFEAAPESAF